MSNTNLLGSEEWAIVGVVDPDANAAGDAFSADIDMSLFEQLIGIVQTGDLGTGATIDFSFVSGAAATPTTAVANKSITQLTDSPAGNNSNDQAIINLRGDELTEGHRYVRAKLVTAVATSDSSAIVLGKAKALPASDNDLASVQEVVS